MTTDYSQKSVKKMPPKPALTPGQQSILALPNIQTAISLFGLEIPSSAEAIIAHQIHDRVATILAKTSGQKPPPPTDLSQFAPLAPSGSAKLRALARAKREKDLPPGYCLDDNDKVIFDPHWKEKGIYISDLPEKHPDYAPF